MEYTLVFIEMITCIKIPKDYTQMEKPNTFVPFIKFNEEYGVFSDKNGGE